MPTEYAPADYDAMFADPARSAAYQAAIRTVVGPDDVVVEIGTGVGYFAVLACRAGARRVYAIELDASVLLAERLVEENGCAGRVVCIRGDANRITLPERGTVLISDLRGVLPMRGDAIATIAGARARHLVPHARLIPRRDTIRAAPCEAPERWAQVELGLGAAPAGVSRQCLAAVARSTILRCHVAADLLCAPAADVATLDYATIVSPHIDGAIDTTIERDARVEGIALWFDADLAPGAGFSTAPAARPTMYAHAFLPFERPLDVQRGDRLACTLRFRRADGRYVWAWDTELAPADPARPRASMRQSTLGAMLRSPDELARLDRTYRPPPAALAAARELLDLADGTRSLEEMAIALARRDPGRFADERAALAWVTQRMTALADMGEPQTPVPGHPG